MGFNKGFWLLVARSPYVKEILGKVWEVGLLAGQSEAYTHYIDYLSSASTDRHTSPCQT